MTSCPKCHAAVKEDQTFCEACGVPLKEGAVRKETSSAPADLIPPKHQKQIREARLAILLVAILTIGVAIFYWFQLQSEMAKVNSNPDLFLIEKAVTAAKAAIFGTLIVGLLFIGLFFWAKKNPFGASLIALIIYITNLVVAAAIDPETIPKGILLKVIIILVLGRGVQTGLAHRKLVNQPNP